MPKKIPKQLRARIMTALSEVKTPHPTSFYAELTRDLPEACHRSPTQMSFILKQLAQDDPRIQAVEVAKNGVSHHGKRRVRHHWFAPEIQILPDDVATTTDIVLPPNQVLITLDDDTMNRLRQRASESEQAELAEMVAQIVRDAIGE